MGKKRARLMAIENKKSRSDTFHKRKMGLLKKAAEFAILCDVKLLLLFEDLAENIIQFSAHEHFDPKVYQNKKVVKLSLTDYPDFFQKHGAWNESQDKNNQGGDAQDSDNEDGDEEDSNSKSSEKGEKASGKKPSIEEINKILKSNGNNELSGRLGEMKNLFANGLNVKTEHTPELHNLKVENLSNNLLENLDFKSQMESLQKSMRDNTKVEKKPDNNTQGSLEALQKTVMDSIHKLTRPEPASMFPGLKDFNPFMRGVDPAAAMSLGASRFPFMGLDPTMMMRNIDPMGMLGMLGGGRSGLGKFGDLKLGDDPSKLFANYYENYFRKPEVNDDESEEKNNNADEEEDGATLKKKVKK